MLLPLGFAPSYAAADFIADGSNAEARAWLADAARWPGRRLAIYGASGRGKTHLLHMWAEKAGASVVEGAGMGRPVFGRNPMAIDDADLAAAEPLLHTLNAASEGGYPVLIAGREPPGRWPASLPDLRSRLRATASAELGEPSDAMREALLARLLAERQMAVAPGNQHWLLARLPRSAAVLREVVARLDRASLAAGRAPTRPLMADVVDAMQADQAAGE